MTNFYCLKNIKYIILIFISFFVFKTGWSQDISNYREKEIVLDKDTIQLDSLSLVPQSEIISLDGISLESNFYEIDYAKAVFILKE